MPSPSPLAQAALARPGGRPLNRHWVRRILADLHRRDAVVVRSAERGIQLWPPWYQLVEQLKECAQVVARLKDRSTGGKGTRQDTSAKRKRNRISNASKPPWSEPPNQRCAIPPLPRPSRTYRGSLAGSDQIRNGSDRTRKRRKAHIRQIVASLNRLQEVSQRSVHLQWSGRWLFVGVVVVVVVRDAARVAVDIDGVVIVAAAAHAIIAVITLSSVAVPRVTPRPGSVLGRALTRHHLRPGTYKQLPSLSSVGPVIASVPSGRLPRRR